MPTLRFEGYSDDTFGEVLHTQDDHDNCASGEPIEYLVQDPATGSSIVVTGQHCPGSSLGWMIGTANYRQCGEFKIPAWPMHFVPDGDSYALVIEAPEGVTLRCLTRERNDG
jgi:hypothetical protein